LRLSYESLLDLLSESKFRWEQLDRHTTLQLLIASTIDHAHTAPAYLALNHILASEYVGQACGKWF
jgi:hypothetical protein